MGLQAYKMSGHARKRELISPSGLFMQIVFFSLFLFIYLFFSFTLRNHVHIFLTRNHIMAFLYRFEGSFASSVSQYS